MASTSQHGLQTGERIVTRSATAHLRCPLLSKLPIEIREKIYGYAIKHDTKWVLHLSLLRVNRQIHGEATSVMLRNHPLIHVSFVTHIASAIRKTLPMPLHNFFTGAHNVTREFKHYKAHLTISNNPNGARVRGGRSEQLDLVVVNRHMWRNMLMLLGSMKASTGESDTIRSHTITLKFDHIHTAGPEQSESEQKRILQVITDMWWSFPHFKIHGGDNQDAVVDVLRRVRSARWQSFDAMIQSADEARGRAHGVLMGGRPQEAHVMFQEASIILSHDVHEFLLAVSSNPVEGLRIGRWSFENTLLCTMGCLECLMAECSSGRLIRPRNSWYGIMQTTDVALRVLKGGLLRRDAAQSHELLARIFQCRAYALRKLCRFKDAQECLEKVYRLKPHDKDIKKELRSLKELRKTQTGDGAK